MKSAYIGSKIFEAEYVSKKFPLNDSTSKATEKVILKDFYYNFSRYEKMGIVGNNGTGKSTFIKMLLGQVVPDAGRFDIGDTVRFGYFSQEGLQFDEQQKVIDVVKDIAEYIDMERQQKDEKEVPLMTTSLKVDENTKMGIVSDVKQELRKVSALKINYSTKKGTRRY